MKTWVEALKEHFFSLCNKFSTDNTSIENIWNQIYNRYTDEKRHYHTLDHLNKMFDIISNYEYSLKNKDAVEFATWFHDVIYNSNNRDNEEQSAEFASECLLKINVPKEYIQKIIKLILLTKSHNCSDKTDFDTQLFLDADMAVLGSDWDEYSKYSNGVRMEYSQYPDMIYKAGRKNVLQNFLNADSIYQTKEMKNKLEERARQNIQSELKQFSV